MAIVQSSGVLSGTTSLAMSRYSGASGVTWFDGLTEDYAAIYRTQPNVRLVVNFFARNIAQLGIKAFERISDNERTSLSGHPISKLIRHPNPAIKLTRFRWLLAMVSDLKIYDNSFWLKMRVDGRVVLFRLPPEHMSPADDSSWFYATKWRFSGMTQDYVFDSDDLIHIHGYNPQDQRMGLSSIESIRQNLLEDRAASVYREQFWRQGARISGVIERPNTQAGTPQWSAEAKGRFMAEWRSNFAGNGPDAGGTPLLDDGMTFKQVSFSAKDSEYLGARRLSREEVAAQYHLSPVFVGILENANFSNVKEQHKHLYQDAFGPDLTMISEDLEAQLLPEFTDLGEDVYLEFNLREKLQGSFEEEAAILQTAIGGPYMTRNEGRARQNMPPLEGADELIVPLNVIEGGQASPTDSAPPVGAASSGPHGAKAAEMMKAAQAQVKADEEEAELLAEPFVSWEEKHREAFAEFMEAQGAIILAGLRNGKTVAQIFEANSWDGELAAVMLPLALEMTEEVGTARASSFDGEFDVKQTEAFLSRRSTEGAKGLNLASQNSFDLVDALAENLDELVAGVAAFRSLRAARDTTQMVGNFADHEGAKQGGATNKVWNVRSSKSRHPRLGGQSVPIDEEFSNGARWPGDHRLKEDDRAGCVCSMSYE